MDGITDAVVLVTIDATHYWPCGHSLGRWLDGGNPRQPAHRLFAAARPSISSTNTSVLADGHIIANVIAGGSPALMPLTAD